MRNRLYRADCRTVAEQLIKENIKADLIYLDPPFNSNRTYSMIFNHRGITAQQKAYHDMWDFTDSTRQLVLDFRDELRTWDLPDSFKEFMRAWLRILEGGTANDRKLLNYLMYMTQRLVRLRDLLKPTGSIFFHCDPTASHYLKVIMDGIFGRKFFRNEIIWHYSGWNRRLARKFNSRHDTLLFYAKSDRATFNSYAEPWASKEEYVRLRKQKLRVDDEGREYVRSDAGGGKRVNRYLDDAMAYGKPVSNVWIVDKLNNSAKEYRGYNTQKPMALLQRIIEASSSEGDLILDPFCGCGTTVEAAQELGRNWIGIDISGDAVDEIKTRMAERGVYDGDDYDVLEGSPDTMAEYMRLNPFEKQDWLVRRLGGLPNPRKSGDKGIDGDMTIHLGIDANDNDLWGRLVFSVKTGKQRNPAHVRELQGTMKHASAQMGVLILDVEPTAGMESAADRAGRFTYQQRKDMPPKSYGRIQIVTADEIIEGAQIDCPPTMQAVKRYRKAQMEMRV